MSTLPVIFIYPINKLLRDFKKQIESREDIELYEIDALDEVQQITDTMEKGILLTSDPKKCAKYIYQNRMSLRDKNLKILLLAKDEIPTSSSEKLIKWGVTDILTGDIKVKTVEYKFNLLVKALGEVEKVKDNKSDSIKISSDSDANVINTDEKRRVEKLISDDSDNKPDRTIKKNDTKDIVVVGSEKIKEKNKIDLVLSTNKSKKDKKEDESISDSEKVTDKSSRIDVVGKQVKKKEKSKLDLNSKVIKDKSSEIILNTEDSKNKKINVDLFDENEARKKKKRENILDAAVKVSEKDSSLKLEKEEKQKIDVNKIEVGEDSKKLKVQKLEINEDKKDKPKKTELEKAEKVKKDKGIKFDVEELKINKKKKESLVDDEEGFYKKKTKEELLTNKDKKENTANLDIQTDKKSKKKSVVFDVEEYTKEKKDLSLEDKSREDYEKTIDYTWLKDKKKTTKDFDENTGDITEKRKNNDKEEDDEDYVPPDIPPNTKGIEYLIEIFNMYRKEQYLEIFKYIDKLIFRLHGGKTSFYSRDVDTGRWHQKYPEDEDGAKIDSKRFNDLKIPLWKDKTFEKDNDFMFPFYEGTTFIPDKLVQIGE